MIKTQRNKIIIVLVLLLCLIPAQSLAALNAYVIKVNNDIYVYEKDPLESSFLELTGKELYQDFLQKFGSGFYAFRDTSGKYVEYKAIETAFLDTPTGQTFNLNQYMESATAPLVTNLPATVKVAYADGTTIKYRDTASGGSGGDPTDPTDPTNPTTGTAIVTQAIAMTNTTIRVVFNKTLVVTDYVLSKFSIAGLTVSVAVLKSGTTNTVTLTTAAQTQGTNYTLTYNGTAFASTIAGLGTTQVRPDPPSSVTANTDTGTINTGGATDLEYSVDGGNTWIDYNPAAPPTGLTGEVWVREKSDGTNPPGLPIIIYFNGTVIENIQFISGSLAGVGYKSIQVLAAAEVFYVEANGTRLKYEGNNLFGNTSTEYTTGMTITIVAKDASNQVLGQRTVTVP